MTHSAFPMTSGKDVSVMERGRRYRRWTNCHSLFAAPTLLLRSFSLDTGVESCSCLFPSTRHQSFNQSKCKEFSKKGFKSIQWRRDLQIDKMIWPINSWHPLIPPDWRQFRPIRCCRGIGGWVDLPLPRHLVTKKEPKILLKMWDHATFANTTFSSSIRISKRAYQLKA